MDLDNLLHEQKLFNSTDRVNVLPQRSYFIPFSIKQDFIFKDEGVIDRDRSEEYISLNGEWEFKAYDSFEDIHSIDESLPDNIPVPSCVQMFGYDQNQYVNLLYPFPFNPPFVPNKNPAFHYRKKVNIKKHNLYHLCFEGVDSAFYVFINKEFVGYSQISHSLSEFDVTDYLIDGDNIIDVIVLKWCKSSYLEDQDKFRFSGIFRNVYFLNRPANYIRDFKIETSFENNVGYIDVYNLSSHPFKVSFNDLVKEIDVEQKERFIIINPNIWSSDNPFLYNIILFNDEEKIVQRVGIRNVSIEDGIFKINNKHIKLKGVNRHEFHPDRGAAITFDDTLKDLRLIKSLGVNAIRTSHYPDMPEFYDLCDALGIYIVNEADVETHGADYPEGYEDHKRWQEFTNSGLFDDGVFDREKCLYERDKNHTCVVIWSLGNESSYGSMFYKGADYIHSHDKRPIHYEGIWNLVNRSEYYTDRIDIVSRMYPEISWLTKGYLDDPKEKRPLMLCEYSHAMGNSNGDLADYWKVLSSNDRFIGAFVWEFNDHAIDINGKLLYGGDSGELVHDGNFCVDGLVSPYREIKTNTLEMEAVYKGKLEPDTPINKCEPLMSLSSSNPLEVEFDDSNASIKQIKYQDKNILTKPITLNYLRAYIDNDRNERRLMENLERAKLIVHSKDYKDNVKHYSVSLSDEKINYIDFDIYYHIYNNSIDIDISYKINGSIDYVPRIGVEFAVNKNNDTFKFFGYGKDESYIDKRIHNTIDEFELKVKENYYPYLKPQESGSHYYSSYLIMKNMKITAKKPFSFNILPYSRETLVNTKHNYELPEMDNTYISLDVFMCGVGTNSCGPRLADKYRTPKEGTNIFRLTFIKD